MRREQRRRERRSSFLIYGVGSFVAVAVLLLAIVPSVLSARSRSQQRSVGYVKAASTAAQAANCTGVRNDTQISRTHVTTPVDYAALLAAHGQQIPPSSGEHNPDPLSGDVHFYSRAQNPPVERAVHNLEHGFVIGWYDNQLPDDQVSQLQTLAGQAGDRFIVVPWQNGTFPDGRHFVLTAWDRTQRCGTVNADVVDTFVKTYSDPSSGQDWSSPTAPESGASGGTPLATTPSTGTTGGSGATSGPPPTATPGGSGKSAPLTPAPSASK
jgi:hypothetical protein